MCNIQLVFCFDLGSVRVDNSSNVYIAGYVSASISGQSYAGGNSDAAIFKLDSNGNLVWVRLIGRSDEEIGTGGMSPTKRVAGRVFSFVLSIIYS